MLSSQCSLPIYCGLPKRTTVHRLLEIETFYVFLSSIYIWCRRKWASSLSAYLLPSYEVFNDETYLQANFISIWL